MIQLSIFDNPWKERFELYHKDNPQIYETFRAFTLRAINRGHRHLSAEFIYNIIRWETGVTEKGGEFKINNNYKPFYSRMFMKEFPEYADFFEKRRSKAD
jgi:hypothetical protein